MAILKPKWKKGQPFMHYLTTLTCEHKRVLWDCRYGHPCCCIGRFWTRLKLMITTISPGGLMWARPRSFFPCQLLLLDLWFLHRKYYRL